MHPRAVNEWLWSWTTNLELLRWKMTSSASHRFSSSLSISACSRPLISLPLFSSTGYKVGSSVNISPALTCVKAYKGWWGIRKIRFITRPIFQCPIFLCLLRLIKKKKVKDSPCRSKSQCVLHLYWAVVNWEVAVADQGLKETRRRRMRP